MECLSRTFPTMTMHTIPISRTPLICAIRPVQTIKQLSFQTLKNHKITEHRGLNCISEYMRLLQLKLWMHFLCLQSVFMFVCSHSHNHLRNIRHKVQIWYVMLSVFGVLFSYRSKYSPQPISIYSHVIKAGQQASLTRNHRGIYGERLADICLLIWRSLNAGHHNYSPLRCDGAQYGR
jgi:hypothetical protein